MSSTVGRLVVAVYTNQSGGSVAYGDLVYIDTAHDDSFTTGTTGAYTGLVGVCIEKNGIASAASGRIQTQGPCPQINLNASGTRGHFVKTHTVAKQATDAGASRVVGAFGQLTTGGSTPEVLLFGFPDASSSSASSGTPGLTLGTSNSGGASANFVAVDATIAAFDATAPSTQAFGDSAAAGSAGVAARRDHKHAMPFTAGAATSYTPALTAASVNPTLGTGSSVEGHYFQLGKLVVCWGVIVFGSSGVAAGTGEYHVSYPVAPVSSIVRIMGHGQFFDSSASRFFFAGIYALDTSNFRFSIDNASAATFGAAAPVTWAANDQIQWMMVYESA